ncbi:FtsW/RodA/SpoVE family cell cycle protein, partial [Deltaproteobacteria bacterium OttesenSCG-928-M10]|nr:FtsW/RodA/SpoVE family cell cycle protein [Deltaproteobacteria bacterium OttesenSCG-928-M10]
MKNMRLDHRLLENFCWPLLLATIGLCICGLLNLYSVSSHSVFTEEWSWFVRQGLYLCLAFIGFTFVLLVDYQYLKRIVWPAYGLSVLALMAVFVVGTNVNGATRWLDLGLFRFQPSESMKVVTVVALAAWFAKRDLTAGLGFKDLLLPILIILVPFVLIHRQPDLGTALHLVATCVPMFLVFR